ncbi:MAG: NAD(P)-dependent oxidoreductase [Rhodospirillaceae bacterium]|nr:NAD(P)-dependent oxidoreductase [Rhodospirillaceae bacterium]
MVRNTNGERPPRLAFVGFGEAAQAFVQGLGPAVAKVTRAFDIKTDHAQAAVRDGKWADYEVAFVTGCAVLPEALADAPVVFSTVTADQALVAAEAAAKSIGPGTLYFDCNSCSPATKRQAAAAIDVAGGRYVDTAVMAPVHPALHRTPVLLSGPHAEAGLQVLEALGMNARLVAGPVGTSSSIKMVRSVMVKGLEALTLECVLAGRRAGVDERVLASLDASFPGFDFQKRAAHMLERVMTHGVRRAAEMSEAAKYLHSLGLPSRITEATVAWQDEIGALGLTAPAGDYAARADALLEMLLAKEDAA